MYLSRKSLPNKVDPVRRRRCVALCRSSPRNQSQIKHDTGLADSTASPVVVSVYVLCTNSPVTVTVSLPRDPTSTCQRHHCGLEPGLDDLLGRPDLAGVLAREAVVRLLAQCATVEGLLVAGS